MRMRAASSWLVLSLFVMGSPAASAESAEQADPPGSLDLRSWDFPAHGPVNLEGNWSFCWQDQPPTPLPWSSSRESSAGVSSPSTWVASWSRQWEWATPWISLSIDSVSHCSHRCRLEVTNRQVWRRSSAPPSWQPSYCGAWQEDPGDRHSKSWPGISKPGRRSSAATIAKKSGLEPRLNRFRYLGQAHFPGL